MKGKSRLLQSVCVVIAVLLLTACTAPTSTPTLPLPATTTPSAATPTLATPTTERPEYGGVLVLSPPGDIGVFDSAATGQALGWTAGLVFEQYLGADWSRGAAGTGELAWVPSISPGPETCAAMLAESWSMPHLGTIVFKVRRGVRWALNPNSEAGRLMNGREVTADDWIAGFNYYMQNPRSLIRAMPQLLTSATMEKTGPWEVTLKTPIDPLVGWNWLALGGTYPPEVIQKYGDMRDWRNVVGTGPFMLTDVVAGSSATLVRNPNYWQADPAGPGKGNRLPYVDGVKVLVILDSSTRLAALRTGKVDLFTEVLPEDARSLIKSSGELKYRRYFGAFPVVIVMRLDKSELPFQARKVRQALTMAVDFTFLKDSLLGGEAETLAFPVTPEVKRLYVPLDEMPESVQTLYSFNPERAKQFLAEAGYPDGFRTKMIVLQDAGMIDLATVYKAMWAKVGVDVEIQVREMVVFASIGYARSYEEMGLFFLLGVRAYPTCLNLGSFRTSMSPSYVNDPFIQGVQNEIQKHVIIDMPEADRLYRQVLPYLTEQAYFVPVPSPYNYSLWWPWVKNHYGETLVRFATYYWIDQDLKQEMTGKR